MAVVVPSLAAALLGIVLPAIRTWRIAAPAAIAAALAALGFSGIAPAAIVLAVGLFAFEAAALARSFRAGDAAALAAVYALLALAFGSVFILDAVCYRLAETPDAGPAIERAGDLLLAADPYAAIVTSMKKDALRQDAFYARFRAADFILLTPRWTDTLALYGGLAGLFALHRLLTRSAHGAPGGARGA